MYYELTASGYGKASILSGQKQLFTHLSYVVSLSIMFGCSSRQSDVETKTVNNSQPPAQVTLSHVKAY
jgi:hypothetical protein